MVEYRYGTKTTKPHYLGQKLLWLMVLACAATIVFLGQQNYM